MVKGAKWKVSFTSGVNGNRLSKDFKEKSNAQKQIRIMKKSNAFYKKKGNGYVPYKNIRLVKA